MALQIWLLIWAQSWNLKISRFPLQVPRQKQCLGRCAPQLRAIFRSLRLAGPTVNLQTKNLDFRGLDSIRFSTKQAQKAKRSPSSKGGSEKGDPTTKSPKKYKLPVKTMFDLTVTFFRIPLFGSPFGGRWNEFGPTARLRSRLFSNYYQCVYI